MTAHRYLLALLIVTAALAGCAENGDNANDGTSPTTTTTTTTTGGGSPGTTPTPTSGGDGDATPDIDSITVGTDATYPPFENTVDGEIVGFDIDVMREIANRSGFTVTFENALFDAIIPAVQQGQFDAGMSAFTITDERKQQVDFSVPYYDNELMAAVDASNQDISEPADLEGQTVCTQKGTTAETYLREEIGLGDDNLLLLDTFPPCADAVERGDAVAMMIDRAAVRDLIQRSEGSLRDAFVVPTDEQFGIAVAKENDALLTAINDALNAMKDDGTLDELMDKWQV